MALLIESFMAYMSARVRGMKRELLSPTELESLLDRGDPKVMTEVLLASPYEKEMAEALTHASGADAVEDAVTRNLVNTFAKLRRIGAGRHAAFVDIFLARWDLQAVKALLRNRHQGLDAQSGGDSLVPGPSMPVPLMNEFASQDSMEALVRGLAAWNPKLCRHLLDALPKYLETRNLRVLEEALDRGYFVGNVRALSNSTELTAGFMVDLLRTEIDRINLRLVFAPRPAGTSPEDVLAWTLPRGYVAPATLRDIASAPSPDRAVSLLERTPYAGLESGFRQLAETGKFSRLDHQFETAIFERLRRGVQRQSIGLGILLLFAWEKYSEVIKIRMIARGLAANLPKEYLREEVLNG